MTTGMRERRAKRKKKRACLPATQEGVFGDIKVRPRRGVQAPRGARKRSSRTEFHAAGRRGACCGRVWGKVLLARLCGADAVVSGACTMALILLRSEGIILLFTSYGVLSKLASNTKLLRGPAITIL